MKNFEIGQKVWFSEPWSKMPKSATIVSFETIEPDKVYKFERKVAKLHWDEGGINSMLVDDLYSTKEEVLCAEKEKSRKRIEKFKEEILLYHFKILIIIFFEVFSYIFLFIIYNIKNYR